LHRTSPDAIALMEAFATSFPSAQIACFDTAFHNTLRAWRNCFPFAALRSKGVQRYGFHGCLTLLMQDSKRSQRESARGASSRIWQRASLAPCAMQSMDTSMASRRRRACDEHAFCDLDPDWLRSGRSEQMTKRNLIG